MDARGITPPSVTLPKISGASASIPSLPAPPSQTGAVLIKPSESGLDAQAIEKKHREAVLKAAQDIANVYVVSDKQFTIFKDSSGQYITRFRDLRDGRVTYIPEPDLFRLRRAEVPSFVEIKA